jgi:hypothetical protein
MRCLLVLAMIALVSGCVSTSREAENVRVTTNPDVVKGCEFLGNVSSTSGWGGPLGTGLGSANTEKDLRNKAARMGGNILFLSSSGVHASGEVYRSPVRPAQSVPANP